jgi:hypothetical protein
VPTLDLTWRDVPPSLNREGRSAPIAQHRIKKGLQATLEGLLMASALPRNLNRVEAWAVMRFPDARRRDEGNFRWMLEKSLGDALTNGRWLTDDTAEQYRFYLVKFDPEKGPRQTIITLRWGEDAPLVEV